MTTEQALLAAIWASPHDDLPRLVYADLLDETGDPAKAARAEFIRVQCELAKLDEDDPRGESLVRVEQRLIHTYGDDWLPHLPKQTTRVGYDRGFVFPTLRISATRLRSRGPNFLRAAPLWALDLELSGDPDEFAALTKTDKLRHASQLRFLLDRYRQNSADIGVWITASDCFRNLTHLDLGVALDSAAPIDQLQEFCRASNLPTLRELSFECHGMTAGTVSHFTQAWFTPGLRSLTISGLAHLSHDGLARLVSAPSLDNLRNLSLGGLPERSDASYLDRFGRHARLPRLRELWTSFDVTDPELIRHYQDWPGATSLTGLRLQRSTASAVRALVEARIFPNLRRLEVWIPGTSTNSALMTFPTMEVITPGTSPGHPVTELVEFAAAYGVVLQLR